MWQSRIGGKAIALVNQGGVAEDPPCSHLRATASEDNVALGSLQASPQVPTTGVAGARAEPALCLPRGEDEEDLRFGVATAGVPSLPLSPALQEEEEKEEEEQLPDRVMKKGDVATAGGKQRSRRHPKGQKGGVACPKA
ncbi:UNVERIFIED_CONTAM: hypothetical protein FKN15_018845 [Acipenser sinensis]